MYEFIFRPYWRKSILNALEQMSIFLQSLQTICLTYTPVYLVTDWILTPPPSMWASEGGDNPLKKMKPPWTRSKAYLTPILFSRWDILSGYPLWSKSRRHKVNGECVLTIPSLINVSQRVHILSQTSTNWWTTFLAKEVEKS